MDDEERQFEETRFIEDVGIVFEQSGLPRMAGRILGSLLVSDPPNQSTNKLAETLLASKGSISTMTRLLIRIGLIERTCMPGVRHDYFRIRADALSHLMEQKLEFIITFRQIADRGLKLMEGKAPVTRQGLEEMRDMYAFFEREFPVLIQRWEQEQKKRQSQLVQEVGSL